MLGEKVKIKLVLTIMVLGILWGINTSASVINQWMAKNVVAQLLDVEKKPGGFNIELGGYHLAWQDDYWLFVVKNGEEGLKAVAKKGMELQQECISRSKLIFQVLLTYWRQIQGKFLFKDEFKSAILDIVVT